MIAESEADKRANHAFFIKNADSLELNNFSVDWNDGQPQSTWKNTIFAINVDHLIIRDFESTPNGNRSNSPIIYLDNTTDVRIENATLTAAEKTFISIEGRNSHNIQLKSIDPLKMSQTPLILSDKISNPSSIQIQDER
jgi:hypothetical protein